MTRTYIDVHVLQTVPPSCVNRDDTGSPKSARYGGVRRARVSSQAWKRATREAFKDLLSESERGTRTKRVVEMVTETLDKTLAKGQLSPDDTEQLAIAAVSATGLKLAKARKAERQETEFLVLVSQQQADAVAAIAREALENAGGDLAEAVTSLGSKEVKAEAKRVMTQGHSVDLALFGRMVANDTDLNVDASCQVAHALSVHAADNEFDYFTAVDDRKKGADEEGGQADSGAGMIGTVEFTSATLYRYATINVAELADSLGDAAAAERGITAFLTAFVRSMPTGKVNTFANNTLPEGIVVSIREDQPVSHVGAFESAVESSTGYAVPAATALREWAAETEKAYGVAPVRTWVVGIGKVAAELEPLGERVAFTDLPAAVARAAIDRVAARETA